MADPMTFSHRACSMRHTRPLTWQASAPSGSVGSAAFTSLPPNTSNPGLDSAAINSTFSQCSSHERTPDCSCRQIHCHQHKSPGLEAQVSRRFGVIKHQIPVHAFGHRRCPLPIARRSAQHSHRQTESPERDSRQARTAAKGCISPIEPVRRTGRKNIPTIPHV